jgi:hypothetical protein
VHDTVHVLGCTSILIFQHPPRLRGQPVRILGLASISKLPERLDKYRDEICLRRFLAHAQSLADGFARGDLAGVETEQV